MMGPKAVAVPSMNVTEPATLMDSEVRNKLVANVPLAGTSVAVPVTATRLVMGMLVGINSLDRYFFPSHTGLQCQSCCCSKGNPYTWGNNNTSSYITGNRRKYINGCSGGRC